MTISAMGSSGAELSHGTLVLLLPTCDGIVTCADKRRWNETTGPSDDAQKIFQLAPQIAFAISGHHEIVVPSADKRLSVLYSLSSSVQSFYSSHPSASHPNWKQLKATLKEEFEAAYLKHNVNALVHRDYAMSGSITISVHPNSLEISNPGALPSELKPSDLKRNHPSLPRNPDVAHVCFLHGLIEKIGRGTQRIVEGFKAAHLPEPKWQTGVAGTTLILRSPLGKARSMEELNDRQQQILRALEDHRQLRPTEVTRLVHEGLTLHR